MKKLLYKPALFAGLLVLVYLLGLVLATLLLYGIGTAWLAFLTHVSFCTALPMGALVFLPLDSIKILFACMLGRKLKSHLK